MASSAAHTASAAATALLVDRFVSASSADDLRESLQGIITALQATVAEERLEPSVIWKEEETLEAFLQVLTSGEYKGIPIDQGPPLVCQIYAELIQAKDSSIILQKPQSGRLVQSLLDVICNSNDSAYARVSALQVLQKICNKYPSVAQTHLLEVPNGLHRLADMFREENEQVRNEMLLLAKIIAQWPSCAKIWVFAEVCDSVIELAVQEGGLTNGNVLVMDCLDLLHSLLKHDASLSDLVWQSPIFANKLASLLDLRRGSEFVNPKKPLPTDDLDDILQSGSEQTKLVVPTLTREEEELLIKVLGLTGVMLASESIRFTVWKRHLALGSLIWELSLLSPPPPGVPHVCAVPSANLQQEALNCVAGFFSSLETMKRHNGLDRLLYLVCTGGASTKFKDKLGLSQSALHVIRQTLSDEIAEETVMHTLAPPTLEDSSEPEPTVVLKLLNTIMENVNDSGSDDTQVSLDRRKINLLGSLGGLCVFMRNTTTREMMLRITSPHSLIDIILKSLEAQDEFIALSFLRFLSEWMVDTPTVVEAVLSSTQSTSLSVLFGLSERKGVMAGLLLGMAMEYMNDQEPQKYGGWTRASILTMISKRSGGISGFMSELENLKTAALPWKACRLEEKMFLLWYNDQVLIVRSRIVQELARGSDAEEDEDQGTGTAALQKIVAQQSRELQELNAALALARSEVELRDSQLDVWKRRVESNPTQLDDMLSEYTAKNVELESTVSKLQSDFSTLQVSHETELLLKEEKINELRNQTVDFRMREEEAITESVRLQGELAALSSAYSNLEEEYNRSQLAGNAAAAGEAMHPGRDGQQPQGEVSSQGRELGTTDADAVRTENARLRNDARAADEWMQLAHQRMGEIGSQNLTLQQELTSAKAALSERSASGADDLRVAQQQLQKATERCGELEREVVALKGDTNGVEETASATLEEEQLLRKDLESKLENAQLDISAALDSLGQSKAQTEGLLRQVDELKGELQLAKANVTALNEDRRQLERKLASQGNEAQTEGETVVRLKADLQNKQHELDSLQASLKSLQDEAASTRSSMGLPMREGKALNDASTGENERSNPNQESQTQEVEKLRAANSAAQEWMESAVEHHQMLADQVANLTADKEELRRQLKIGKKTAITVGDDGMLERLQESLDSRDSELELLKRSMQESLESRDFELEKWEQSLKEKRESEVEELKQSLQEALDFRDSELERLKQDLERVQAANDETTSTKEELLVEVASLQAELLLRAEGNQLLEETIRAQEANSDGALKQLQNEVHLLLEKNGTLEKALQEEKNESERVLSRMTELSNENDTKSTEILDMASKLTEFEQWSAAAQERLTLLTTEKETAEQHASKLEAMAANSGNGINELEALNDKLKAENSDLKIRIETLSDDFEIQVSRLSELESSVEEKQVEVASAEKICEQVRADLEAAEKEAFAVTNQWQKTAIALEEDIAVAKEALGKQENDASEVIAQWSQRCTQLEQSEKKLQLEIDDMVARETGEFTAKIDELESTIKILETTLEAQQEEGLEAVEQWSSRCSELDEVVKELSSQCEALSTEKLALEASISETMNKERALKESFTMQIQLLEKEASLSQLRLSDMVDENQKTVEGLKTQVETQEAIIVAKELCIRNVESVAEDLRHEMKKFQSESLLSSERSEEIITDLQSTLAYTERELAEIEDEAKMKLKEWESRCEKVEGEKSILKKDLETQQSEFTKQLALEREARLLADNAVGDAETQIDVVSKQSEDVITQWQERVLDLETINLELEAQLEQQQTEAMDAIAQWEGTCRELELKASTLKNETEDATRILMKTLQAEKKKHFSLLNKVVDDYSGDFDFDIQPDIQIEEIAALFSSMTQGGHDATVSRIQELKTAVLKSNVENKSLEESLEAKEAKLKKSAEDLSKLQSLVHHLDASSVELEKKCAALEKDISTEHSRSKTIEAELQINKSNADDQTASSREKDAEIKKHVAEISTLRLQFEALQVELSKAIQNGEAAKTTAESLNHELSEATTTISRVEKLLEESMAARSIAEEDLEAQRLLVLEWETNRKENDKTDAALRERCDHLQAEVVRLFGELSSVNGSLQVHITDEVSRRATEMATLALRIEMDQMRSDLDTNEDVIFEERRGRLAAEEEAKNLKSDLALVLRVTNEEGDTDDKIKSLVMKTSDTAQMKERQEIDRLRKSLGRVIQELEASQVIEKETLSRTAAAELQASICEQEVISAKSDVAFLTQNLEETRENEAARVASFEYRICALEEDRDLVRRYHADEIETLRNELSHVSMEKDRILHSLKESERINTALVYETSKEHETETAEHVDNELSKLRTSNTRLLSAATEEGARTERRIREAVAANASIVEADVIVERELRAAAETALENVKSQLEESRRSQLEEPAVPSKQTLSPDRLKTHLSQSREKSRKLEAENAVLKRELKELESTSKAAVFNLTDECRHAQALVLKLEGDAQFGSAVNLEATKLQSMPNQSTPENWVVVNKTSSNSVIADGLPSTEAYDFITELKSEIQEERQMYQELLAEHDDLLALLAQQDLEKASLNQALNDVAGPRAVDAAIQEAEENAIKQFGKYVRLAS